MTIGNSAFWNNSKTRNQTLQIPKSETWQGCCKNKLHLVQFNSRFTLPSKIVHIRRHFQDLDDEISGILLFSVRKRTFEQLSYWKMTNL